MSGLTAMMSGSVHSALSGVVEEEEEAAALAAEAVSMRQGTERKRRIQIA
jgi:hypothetical protein